MASISSRSPKHYRDHEHKPTLVSPDMKDNNKGYENVLNTLKDSHLLNYDINKQEFDRTKT